jgi:hypothetical protein
MQKIKMTTSDLDLLWKIGRLNKDYPLSYPFVIADDDHKASGLFDNGNVYIEADTDLLVEVA